MNYKWTFLFNIKPIQLCLESFGKKRKSILHVRKYNKYRSILMLNKVFYNTTTSVEKIKNRVELEKKYDNRVV